MELLQYRNDKGVGKKQEELIPWNKCDLFLKMQSLSKV